MAISCATVYLKKSRDDEMGSPGKDRKLEIAMTVDKIRDVI